MTLHDAALLKQFPIDGYVRPLLEAPAPRGYGHLPPSTRALAREVEAHGGAAALAQYHRRVIETLLTTTHARIAEARLPRSIAALLAIEHGRIARELDTQ